MDKIPMEVPEEERDPTGVPEGEQEDRCTRRFTPEEQKAAAEALEQEGADKKAITFRLNVLKLWPGFRFMNAAAFQTFLLEQGMKGASLEVETVEGCRRHGRLTKVVGKDIKLGEEVLSLPEEIILDNDDTDPIRLSNVVRISPWSPEV
jgi:hypothetical protein